MSNTEEIPTVDDDRLKAEADAFDQRIIERLAAGMIPDLRRSVKCEYFYKSFWRDPHFLDLYLGSTARTLVELLGRHGREGMRILDVGCGPGYCSLEIAIAGHHVFGIDVSKACIDSARETLKANPFLEGFGSLRYEAQAFHEAEGIFDVVMFTGALHHFPEIGDVMRKTGELLSSGGLVLCFEPCHDSWRLEDAAQVALIRKDCGFSC
jgi:2-polyprenyl-3-methyl-5-hydroxy-6-metoxy-1,4-benzoquinol methylase